MILAARDHGMYIQRVLGYVYLIRAGERIKVGRSQNVNSRIRTFQTGNAEQCEIVFSLRLLNADEIGQQLKNRLAPHKHREEWFNVSCREAVERLLQRCATGFRRFPGWAQRDSA